MSYTATALCRTGSNWVGHDVDLDETEDIDGLIDLLRELQGSAQLLILFLEEDDEYVAVVRLTGDDDAQVFVSDSRVLFSRSVAARVLGEDLAVPESNEDDEDDESGRPEVQPAGEVGLLVDLGIDADALLQLCAEEGQLPSDVIYTLCEKLGCVDALEAVRGL